MREELKELKEQQKETALVIRSKKFFVKELQRKKDFWGLCIEQQDLDSKRWSWRHRHIAYSMMKGKSYGQIEATVREGNEPDFRAIKSLLRDYGFEVDSTALNHETKAVFPQKELEEKGSRVDVPATVK